MTPLLLRCATPRRPASEPATPSHTGGGLQICSPRLSDLREARGATPWETTPSWDGGSEGCTPRFAHSEFRSVASPALAQGYLPGRLRQRGTVRARQHPGAQPARQPAGWPASRPSGVYVRVMSRVCCLMSDVHDLSVWACVGLSRTTWEILGVPGCDEIRTDVIM